MHTCLLEGDLLLVQNVNLGLEVVDLVDVGGLQFQVVLLEVGDVLNHLLEDVVGGLGRVVLQSRALTPQQLNILLILIELLERGLGASLPTKIISLCFSNLHRWR